MRLQTNPCVDGDVAVAGFFLLFFSVSPRSPDQSSPVLPPPLPRLVFGEGGKVGVNPGLKTPP